MASPNWSEAVTVSLSHREKKLADNVTKNNAILSRLSKRGKIRKASGGNTIAQELMYAETSGGLWYSGYDMLNISPSDVITAAEFDWKQFAIQVSISGLERLKNSGPERMIDLLEARIENAEMTMKNTISAGLYADGTGSGGKEIGGLQLLVADSPSTGTVGGINRATYSFWRNYARDSSDNAVTLSATTVQSEFGIMYVNTARGNDKVDLIMVDNNIWLFYLASLQAIQRITNDDLGQAGFMNLKYMGADVVFDGGGSGMDGGIPANHAYFLNTNYLHWRPHTDMNMVALGGERVPLNQDALVRFLGFAGNATISGARFHGVLKA